MAYQKLSVQQEMADYTEYFGKGSEKLCYTSPKHPGRLLKVSTWEQSLHIRREIEYLEFLRRRGVRASFMPEYFGSCQDDERVGYVQELIAGPDVVFLQTLVGEEYGPRLREVELAILRLKQEMEQTNIIVLDLHQVNILADRQSLKLWVIDGYGPTEFIPLPKYFRFFGTLKINRLWKRVFLRRYGAQLKGLAKKHGGWVESLLIPRPPEWGGEADGEGSAVL